MTLNAEKDFLDKDNLDLTKSQQFLNSEQC